MNSSLLPWILFAAAAALSCLLLYLIKPWHNDAKDDNELIGD